MDKCNDKAVVELADYIERGVTMEVYCDQRPYHIGMYHSMTLTDPKTRKAVLRLTWEKDGDAKRRRARD